MGWWRLWDFFKGFISPLKSLTCLPTALVCWDPTSAPQLHGSLPEIFQCTRLSLLRAFHVAVPSAGHALPPALFLVTLLLLRTLLSYCASLEVCPKPQAKSSPPHTEHLTTLHYLHSTVLWARLCSRHWAHSGEHIKGQPCPSKAEFQWEFLQLP